MALAMQLACMIKAWKVRKSSTQENYYCAFISWSLSAVVNGYVLLKPT